MKQLLTAFSLAFTSACFVICAINMKAAASDLPPTMYSGGREIARQPVLTLLTALGIATALIAAGLLIAIARKHGRALPNRRLYIGTWACLLPALYLLTRAALRAAA